MIHIQPFEIISAINLLKKQNLPRMCTCVSQKSVWLLTMHGFIAKNGSGLKKTEMIENDWQCLKLDMVTFLSVDVKSYFKNGLFSCIFLFAAIHMVCRWLSEVWSPNNKQAWRAKNQKLGLAEPSKLWVYGNFILQFNRTIILLNGPILLKGNWVISNIHVQLKVSSYRRKQVDSLAKQMPSCKLLVDFIPN